MSDVASGALLPEVRAPLPAPLSTRAVESLARTESPAITARRARRAERAGAPHDPIVWVEARGCNVLDADGNRYVDLSSGFGVAAIGHGHAAVREAIRRQSDRVVHGLGDVHPTDVKIALLEKLAALAPFPGARVILGANGSDAIDAALKTAALHTGRAGVLAFAGGYHGLHLGPLAACGYQEAFRAPFRAQLNPHVVFAPYPRAGHDDPGVAIAAVERTWDAAGSAVGAVLVEPILGRGGVIVPPPGFLRALGELAHARGAVVIADEILTGLGRCGSRWRSSADGLDADVICAGKALGGGLPLSACLGREAVMASWGDPAGEALHTSTFLGHPLACAAALAALEVIDAEGLVDRADRSGRAWRDRLQVLADRGAGIREVRGAGMMIGIDLGRGARTLAVVRRLLERGWIALPAAPDASVLQLLPPIAIPDTLRDAFVEVLGAVLVEVP